MSTWLEQLKVLVSTLKRYGDRVAETCCRHDERAYQLINSFSAAVYEARWGAIARAVGQVVEIEPFLRKNWSRAAFTFHEEDRESAMPQPMDDSKRVRIAEMDACVSSELFWRYCEMIQLIALTFRRLELWSEGCPSVLRAFCAEDPRIPLSAHAKACQMRGKRAPEVAMGCLQAILQTLAREGSARLALRCSMLDSKEVGIVCDDFSLARAHLEFTLTVKLAFWRGLPFPLRWWHVMMCNRLDWEFLSV